MAILNLAKGLRSLTAGLSLLVLAQTQGWAVTPHYVLAHYMVCFACYGQTVDDFKREIQDAQASGIDGFALNVGAWSGPDTYYKTRVESIYRAAEIRNTGFKLFFSVDMANTNDIVQMVSAYANRTNSFYHNGKLVISSFCGNGFWWTNGVFQPLQSLGVSNVFFIPFFTPETGSWQTLNVATANLLAKYGGFVDGLFEFGVGLPKDIVYMNGAYGQACKNAGKIFMAGCSPSYWGCAQLTTGRTYFESQGGEGTISQWNWIIQNQPDWVQIVSWNDLAESSYMNPLATPDQNNLSTQKRYSHAGYLALAKHYISWYKIGREPAITKDAIYYFYRTHATNATARITNDIPVTVYMGDVQDVIYTSVWLTGAATLEVISGTNRTTNSLSAGITNLRFPFASGTQIFSLKRDGYVTLTVQGPDILSQINYYNFFPASGYIRRAITPPQNLHPLSD